VARGAFESAARAVARVGVTSARRGARAVANGTRTIGWERSSGPPTRAGATSSFPAPAGAVPVVMCVWGRLDRLPRTIDLLRAQTAPVSLHIWNNNRGAAAAVDRVVRTTDGLAVTVTHSSRNIGGFGRFYLARTLAPKHPFVLFIDDDLTFGEELVETLVAEARPRSISGWWAFRFTGEGDYASRTAAAPGEHVHYCGTGGMVADTAVFLEPSLFACPRRFWFVEDLWLSYVADHRLGWQLRKSAVRIDMDTDGQDQFVYLWATKSALLRHLVEQGWSVVDRPENAAA
jgi:hypothetical protein